MKKISMQPKPQSVAPATADEWVSGATVNDTTETATAVEDTPPSMPVTTSIQIENVVRLKRLTLDIPEELHSRIKSQCALRSVKMVDAIRQILEDSFPV
jgi:hypothetical protein